ncbi:MAG: SDR family oxidoreductase, partial [Geminicoccaceae bacterium]
ATLAEVEALGGRALALPVDVADAAAVDATAERVERELGPIDVWVNDAMVTAYAPLSEITPEEYRRITEVVYLGQVHGTMAALKRMRPRDRGTIVLVGSALAYRGVPLQAAYCGAKFAIRGFADALRSELLHDGSRIRLSMVQLPAINTPQFEWGRNEMPMYPQPVPPIFQPELPARAILRAAYEAPRELWVGAPTLKLILGQFLAPEYIDRQLATMGYQGQQTDQRDPGGRPDNLFDPVPGDHGAHGRFDARANGHGMIVDPTRLRQAVAAAGALLLGVSALAAGARLLARPRA